MTVAAFGTTLSINGQDVSGVQDIEGPDDSYDWADTTSHSSPDRTEEGVPTVRRTGEVTFNLVLKPGDEGQEDLLAAHDAIAAGNHTPDTFVLGYPDGGTRTFDGYVMRFGSSAPVTGALTVPVMIRPTGAVAYVPGS